MKFIDCKKSIQIRHQSISSSHLISVAEATNDYIKGLTDAFKELGFDIFTSLGQRNISGFIGEIFKNLLANSSQILLPNPHPDGRPDVLLIDSPEVHEYYNRCFTTINNRALPIKDMFTPFQYGGIEVKCSVGSSSKPLTNRYISQFGHGFDLYKPRVGYLSGITWWAHHSSSSNLLGLYYDYYAPDNGTPQIIAAFYSELTENDWHAVSTGDPNHKKTSNTSLNADGLQKMKNNCLFYCSDTEYTQQLKRLGIRID